MATILLDRVPIGPAHPPVFWPDIDVYFKGNLGVAEAVVRALRNAGVQFIKGALIHRPDLCLDADLPVSYFNPDKGVVQERYRTVIERHVCTLEQSERLYTMVQRLGLGIVLTVYDFTGVDFARAMGSCALKIASSNIVHQPLIQYAARQGLPLVIDTGKSSLHEIARAVQWARDAGADRLIVQHSPAAPPAGLDQHHLRMLHTLAQTFGCPVGLSDHHRGEEMLYAAVALGASVLEKGVCADGTPYDIDIAHAMPVSQVKEVLEKCGRIWQALGQPMRTLPTNRPRPPDRMGLVTARDVAPGDPVSLETVAFAMPTVGIPVEFWGQVDGWRFNRPLTRGTVIHWSDLGNAAS
jgi:sialic acid synthase SpsE